MEYHSSCIAFLSACTVGKLKSKFGLTPNEVWPYCLYTTTTPCPAAAYFSSILCIPSILLLIFTLYTVRCLLMRRQPPKRRNEGQVPELGSSSSGAQFWMIVPHHGTDFCCAQGPIFFPLRDSISSKQEFESENTCKEQYYFTCNLLSQC